MFKNKFSFYYKTYPIIGVLNPWYAFNSHQEYILIFEDEKYCYLIELDYYLKNRIYTTREEKIYIKEVGKFVDENRFLKIFNGIKDETKFNSLCFILNDTLKKHNVKKEVNIIQKKINTTLTDRERKRIKTEKIEREARLMQTQKYKKF